MGLSPFVCPRWTNISYTQERGGTNIFTLRGGPTFYVGGGGAYDDVDEDIDVSEGNILVCKASKLSAGARIFRDPIRTLKF